MSAFRMDVSPLASSSEPKAKGQTYQPKPLLSTKWVDRGLFLQYPWRTMANITREDLGKLSVKLTITVPMDEMQPFLQKAAEELSAQLKVPGFRPGHATYEAVKNNVGEMKILEAAVEPIVRKTFVEAVASEKLETAGSPEINMEKMAPGNDLVYTATVALMPQVEKLADVSKLSVKKNPTEISDKDMDKALKELQTMQTKEVRGTAEELAKKEDKVVVDMSMSKDKVAVEGGDALGYHVFLSEPNYIPGFSEELLGMKEGESKTFTLTFPKEHYQKHLAGSPVEFTVKLNELYHLDHPTLDDAFAKALGQKDLTTLKDLLRKNLQEEKVREEEMRLEKEVLESVANASRFSDIPDLIVNEEVNKMVHELEHHIEEQGGQFDDYVKSIGKTIAQLKMDFTPQALQRIKVMLVLRAWAKEHQVMVEAKELDVEIDKVAEGYEQKEMKDRVYSPMYRDYMENVLRNKKVIAMLKGSMVK